MAPVKRYYVFHAQDGSFPMMVKHFSDLKLAQEVAAGVAGGTGFVLEGYVDLDPGISGGMDVEVRDRVSQAEGRALRQDRQMAAAGPGFGPGSVLTEDSRLRNEAEIEKRVAKELERLASVVEDAAKKTESKPVIIEEGRGGQSATAATAAEYGAGQRAQQQSAEENKEQTRSSDARSSETKQADAKPAVARATATKGRDRK